MPPLAFTENYLDHCPMVPQGERKGTMLNAGCLRLSGSAAPPRVVRTFYGPIYSAVKFDDGGITDIYSPQAIAGADHPP